MSFTEEDQGALARLHSAARRPILDLESEGEDTLDIRAEEHPLDGQL